MEPYFEWDQLKALPLPAEFMAYVGKSLELVSGICLTIGFLTRIASLFLAINMLFITFYIGNGAFYYQDQHPFLFAIIGLIFFVAGPVKWDVDHKVFK
jgi:putative oxidoreductase